MKRWKLLLTSLTFIFSTSIHAALVERLNGLAFYDTEANLTWLADANAAIGSAYDTYLPGTGLMNWPDANAWAAELTVDGISGWRLPYSDDCRYRNCDNSEMGNLFFNVFGGNPMLDPNENVELFTNIQFDRYWSATELGPDSRGAYYFDFSFNGEQSIDCKYCRRFYAWAVYSGDVSVVPIPAAGWLFASGFLCLVGFAQRKKSD